MELPFLRGSLPPEFRRWRVVLGPGRSRAFHAPEWRDALVLVEAGVLDLECRRGGVRRFDTGAILPLGGLALRALHCPGPEPTVLIALHRRRTVEPRIVDLPARPYLGIRRTCTVASVDLVADRIPRIVEHVLARGAVLAGAPFLRYRVIEVAGNMQMEAGVPVDGGVFTLGGLGAGEITAGALPAGRYLVNRYTGHPEGLVDETAAVLDWAAANGHTWDMALTPVGEHWGCRVEHFLTSPAEEPGPHRWETELMFRLADGPPASGADVRG